MDKIDERLILALKKNAETPIQELGRRLGLSKSAIAVRIKKLWQDEIIIGTQNRLNYDLFGLKQRAFLFIQGTDFRGAEIAKALAADRKNFPEVLRTYLITGDYDIVIRFVTKDTQSVFDVISRIQKTYNDFINICSTVIVVKTYKEGSTSFHSTDFNLKPNKTDIELLFKLQENKSILQIAKEMSLTPRAVYYKLSKYRERGWLTTPTILRNPHKLFEGFVLVDTKPDEINKIALELKQHDEIASLYQITSHHNLLASVVAPTNKEYLRIAERIWPCVKRTKTSYVLDVYPAAGWNAIDLRSFKQDK